MSLREHLLEPFAHVPPPRALDALGDTDAIRRPEGLPHSVAEVVAHMTFWQAWFLRRIEGFGDPLAGHAAEGWPVVRAGEWQTIHDTFLEGLTRAVAIGEGGRESAPIDPPIEFAPLSTYTVGDALLHIAAHNTHHLGQVITLRQLLGRWPPPSGGLTW